MFKFIAAVILSVVIATPAFAYTKAEREAMYAAADLKEHSSKWFTTYCDHEVTPVLTTVKLGAIGEAAMLKIDGGVCYGVTGSYIMLFRKEENHFQTIFDAVAAGIKVLETSHMGVSDLEVGGSGMEIPIWKWNGRKYEFWKNSTVDLSKPPKAESVTKVPVAVGEPRNHYCGIVRDYGDADQIMDRKFNPYWDRSESMPPKDPKGLVLSPLLREGNCLCVDGAVKVYDRAGKQAYAFTDILGLKTCDAKPVSH